MSRKTAKNRAAARDRPKSGENKRSLVWLGDWQNESDLQCAGYTSLAQSPEVSTAIDRIAAILGAMPIQLFRNGEKADTREYNGLSRIVDIDPNSYMTRSDFIRWIVRTLYLHDGNCVVLPRTDGGYLRELRPIPRAYCAFLPDGLWGYRIAINGREYDPETLLHFKLNSSDYFPWLGVGVHAAVGEIADNLKQATATERGFMRSKWKPSIIVKVDALVDEFASQEGRKKLLDSYVTTSEAGQPWLIPADQFDVQTVKPLSLSDLALADFVTLDKKTVASVLGVPPFLLGVGEFKREEWNNFVTATIMPLAEKISQEMTKKLLYSTDLYFRFNPRALMNYSIEELVSAGGAMIDRMAMRRNEWRSWLGLPYDSEMDELLALENFIPANRLGDQKKLNEGGENGEK